MAFHRYGYRQFHSGQYEDARLRELWPACPVIGTFVDVGAGDGVDASNTLHFARNGWTGLLIDASPRRCAQLHENRPDSRIEQAAVSNSEERRIFYIAPHPDNSGLIDHSGGAGNRIEVVTVRLEQLLQRHHIEQIDLLSIDVEGTELEVWDSLDHARHRPKSVVIEHCHTGQLPGDLFRKFAYLGYVLLDLNYLNLTMVHREFLR